MKMKAISMRLALTVTAGMAACSLQAQGTISATATITETGTSGSEYEYSLELVNTGSTAINAFWYGWVKGSFDLPATPTSLAGPSGWTGSPDGDSVQFANDTGSAIAANGGTGMFTFESTTAPSALTSGTTDHAPTGDSVVYSAASYMTGFDENDPPHASGPFVPTLQEVPEPSSFGLLATGLAGMSAWLARRRN